MKRVFAAMLLALLLFCVCGCEKSPGASVATADEASPNGTASQNRATRDSAEDGEPPTLYTKSIMPPPTRSVQNVRDDFDALNELLEQPLKHRSAQLDVEFINQYPELPTGCESVAVTSALRYLGFDLEKTEFADLYLVYGDEVMWSYVGDPTSSFGAGIFPPGLTECTNTYLAEQETEYFACNTMGTELTDLYKLIDAGFPVVVWTTIDYSLPFLDEDVPYYYGEEEFYWFEDEHCVVLSGYDLDKGTVTFCDPTNGIVTVDAEDFSTIYNITGELSMTIMK